MDIARQQLRDNTSAMESEEAQIYIVRSSRETYERRAWLRLSRSAMAQLIPYVLQPVKMGDADSNYRKGYLNP